MRKHQILITGCSGFLASHLIDTLKTQSNDLYGISDLHPEPDFLSALTEFKLIDIRDKNALNAYVNRIKPEIVYHLAAVTNVGYSWSHSALTYEINLNGSSNLIEALASNPEPCRIILLSSAELYKMHTMAHTETDPLECRSPYALSKWAMEKLVELFAHHRQLSFFVVRAFNFTGPRQSPKFVASDFARQIALIEQGVMPPEIRVGNTSAVRDFSDVRDIARYLVEIGHSKSERPDLVNLCSGQGISIEGILNRLLEISSSSIQVIPDPERFRPVDTPILIGDPSKAVNEYGLHPRYRMSDTLFDLLNYWRRQGIAT